MAQQPLGGQSDHPLAEIELTRIHSWAEWLELFGQVKRQDELLNLLHNGFGDFPCSGGYYVRSGKDQHEFYLGYEWEELSWERVIFYLRLADGWSDKHRFCPQSPYNREQRGRFKQEPAQRAFLELSQHALRLLGSMAPVGKFLEHDYDSLWWMNQHARPAFLQHLFWFFRLESTHTARPELYNLPRKYSENFGPAVKRVKQFLLALCDFGLLTFSRRNDSDFSGACAIFLPFAPDIVDVLMGMKAADLLLKHWEHLPRSALHRMRELIIVEALAHRNSRKEEQPRTLRGALLEGHWGEGAYGARHLILIREHRLARTQRHRERKRKQRKESLRRDLERKLEELQED